MLRASSKLEGVEVNLAAVSDAEVDSGIPNGRALNALAEAVVGDDDTALDAARGNLLVEMGPAALVDAAGAVATFMQMDRIADGTGIPIASERVELTRDLRESLGINNYASAHNTPGALQ